MSSDGYKDGLMGAPMMNLRWRKELRPVGQPRPATPLLLNPNADDAKSSAPLLGIPKVEPLVEMVSVFGRDLMYEADYRRGTMERQANEAFRIKIANLLKD